MKILFAYCHELDRIVSIDEARVEYFAIEETKRKRFLFSCSDRACCKVAVTGVNYHVKAEDGQKIKVAHFRSHIPHEAECEWRKFEKERDEGKRADESEQDYSERQIKRKLNDYIDSFDPFTGEADDEVDAQKGSPAEGGRGTSEPERKGHAGNPRQTQYTRTNRLQRFIDSWLEAKNMLSDDEFKALTFNLANYGRVAYHRYVTHISHGVHNEYSGVIYGGATLVKRYGAGFLLRFFDEINGRTVKLYVDKSVVGKSRLMHYINAILDTPDMRYFKVFLLNPTYSNRIDARGELVTNLEITDLRQMVIYLGHEVNSKTDDDSASEDNDG